MSMTKEANRMNQAPYIQMWKVNRGWIVHNIEIVGPTPEIAVCKAIVAQWEEK
jgi:hypothetical protein